MKKSTNTAVVENTFGYRIESESIEFAPIPTVSNFQNLTGLGVNHLSVIGFAGVERGKTYWYCACKCGVVSKKWSYLLKNGLAVSCGCAKKEATIKRNTRHGHSVRRNISPSYSTFKGMRRRCLSPNSDNYHLYGGRGISICERWNSFQNFLSDMGERPDGMSIERIDNNGNYEPGNCRWATKKEQANNMRTNHLISYNGKTQTISEWADELGCRAWVFWSRIKRGWSIERMLTTPVKTIL